MSRIFISYRRSDAPAESGRIYDCLKARFGRAALFKDVDTIRGGDNFRQRLHEALETCEILLVVIGRSWLQVRDDAGMRRLDNPNDWVRLEIEMALQRDIRVIPLLLDGVAVLSKQDLPRAIKPLADLQALSVRNDPDFHYDMKRVLTTIEQYSASPSILSLVNHSSRRRLLGLLGSGFGAALVGRAVRRSGVGQLSNPPTPSGPDSWEVPTLAPPTVNGTTAEFNVATVNISDKSIEIARKQAELYTEDLGNGVTLDMMAIPGGSFLMGSLSENTNGLPLESFRGDNEGPTHEVNVPSFFIGKYPVTQEQWQAIVALPKIDRDLEPSPFAHKGNKHPVEKVDWYAAVEFCQRLSVRTGREYRLPSESEWEYACRAGTTTPFNVGETITTDLSNYRGIHGYAVGPKGDNRQKTTEAGSFPANAFGLYDMHGNIWEWCADHLHDNYQDAPPDGSAWLTDNENAFRILRGGSWGDFPWDCRSAYRNAKVHDTVDNSVGFRVSCTI